MTAQRAGAEFIKVFPAGTFGLGHIEAMLREMPQVNLVPTGGVTPENLHGFFEVGCRAVAVGSQLVSKEILRARDWDRVTHVARRYVEAIAVARSAGSGR
jgi:2-dehydro-3-deoxyphosphogluconate aldolase/(4S)-4-hydroxy-2-oxoglutarate aldolase